MHDIRRWVRQDVSDEEIIERLQKRAPGVDLLPEPGGAWNWLLGLIAAGLVSVVLLITSRRLIQRRHPPPDDDDTAAVEDEWEDRLDDELREID